jgi:superfamily II DNA or RNA helicase
MSIREKRQADAVQAYLNSDRRSIINACPRFGKIKVALDIMKELDVNHIWILAPRNDIFKGWNDDMDKFGYRPTIIGETTFTSIKKIETKLRPQFIILDEPHEMSINQQVALAGKLKGWNGPILGLTGTLTDKTKNELYDNLNLDTCYSYSIGVGVAEGILTDYQIYVHQVPLDDTEKRYKNRKGWLYTEKGYFHAYLKAREKMKPRERWFMDIKLIHFLQNSFSKMKKTFELINKDDERVLVFCGTTEIADQLGIPVYHSKAREKEIFNSFCKGEKYNKLATIKMMQAGITITPIHRGIVNYMSGNPEDSAQKICRFLGFEYDNPTKKAEIHIVSSNEGFETMRLKTGLAFFDQSKIITIKN